MFKTGLLVLSQPLPLIRGRIPAYLTEIGRLVNSTIYIHIHQQELRQPVEASRFELVKLPFTTDVRNIVKEFYSSSAKVCSKLDVRILLGQFGNTDKKLPRFNLTHPCDIVIADVLSQSNLLHDGKADATFIQAIAKQFSLNPEASFQLIDLEDSNENITSFPSEPEQNVSFKTKTETSPENKIANSDIPVNFAGSQLVQTCDNVVLGGTFDRLHTGHKMLLTEACLLANVSLTVGVTDGIMNAKKTLWELMQSTDDRIHHLREFLEDVKPGIEYRVVPITDMFGPTITNPDLDLIVVSEETKRGGEIVNAERLKKGFKPMQQYVIELVQDTCHGPYEEDKISSSSFRKRLLGTLLTPPKVGTSHCRDGAYVIGLTGGIASGKSSICNRLEGLGASIIDCDKLGHKAYVKGTAGFIKVVEAFGEDIIGDDGEIDRKQLGPKVFADKTKLELLNSLIWPEIGRLAQVEMEELANDGTEVIVLDAAVLLEAGWEGMCHEVWTTIVPPAEAVTRIMDRNKLTEEQAKLRLASQISNTERVQRSNVVLSTLWEYEYTQQQVEKAWALLADRMKTYGDIHRGSNT